MFTRNRNLGNWWDDITGAIKKGGEALKPVVGLYKEVKGEPSYGPQVTTQGGAYSYATERKDDIMAYLPYIAIGGILLLVLMRSGSSRQVYVTSPREEKKEGGK